MSEVKRYWVPCGSMNMDGWHQDDNEVVLAGEHDKAMKAAQSELAALREELAKANDKIDQAWNRKSCVDHKGFIPGALDAWKRPVPQDLPYDFSGNPGASATQYCNGWNDSGSYWSAHANELQQRLTAAEQRNAEDYRDAARYRYIRQQGEEQNYICLAETMEGMDAAIDAKLVKPTESGASE